MNDIPPNIPSFLLGREPRRPRSGRGAPEAAHRSIGPPPHRGPYAITDGVVTLVAEIDLDNSGYGI